MRPFRFLMPALLVALAGCADEAAQPAAPDAGPHGVPQQASFSVDANDHLETTGQHIVLFSSQNIPRTFARDLAAAGGELVSTLDAIGVAIVAGLDEAGVAKLGAGSGVRSVEPDHLLPMIPDVELAVEAAGELSSPDDPAAANFFPRQWHLRAIEADVAWAAGHLGSPDVTVAILDTGIGYLHADVAGLVDLGRSASFVPSDDALVEAFFPGAHPVADLHWHGTHVAATVSSNAFAAAGVTSRTTLIGVKVCNVNGSCPTSGVLAGMVYAADQGANVLNLSLGGLFLKSASPGFVSTIERAVNYVNRSGAIVVVSAGNSTSDLDRNIVPLPTNIPLEERTPTHLPSLYASYCTSAQTVCVSATGPLSGGTVGPWVDVDTPTPYTSFGRSAIDVAAPGGSAGGAVWAACSPFSLVVPVCQTGTFILGAGGTSMASPHVAGVAALLVGRLGNNTGQVSQALHQTADKVAGPGTDPFIGKGRVNAARAAGVY